LGLAEKKRGGVRSLSAKKKKEKGRGIGGKKEKTLLIDLPWPRGEKKKEGGEKERRPIVEKQGKRTVAEKVKEIPLSLGAGGGRHPWTSKEGEGKKEGGTEIGETFSQPV